MSVVRFSLKRKTGDGARIKLSPTTDSRDARAGRGSMAFASGPTIPLEPELMLSKVDR